MKPLVKIQDAVVLDIYDTSLFEGSIEEVSRKILGIREEIEKLYIQRQQNYPNFSVTPFSDYKEIRIVSSYDFDASQYFSIECYREKTDEEIQIEAERLARATARRKEAAEKRKKTMLEKEKALFEKLKIKYEKDA
jgi:hypothetical protein